MKCEENTIEIMPFSVKGIDSASQVNYTPKKIRLLRQKLWKQNLIICCIVFTDVEPRQWQKQYISHKSYCILPDLHSWILSNFLLQVKQSFLFLHQSGAFNMPEPRCHLRESQDLSVYEWEEMVEEFTQHTSHSIITHHLCFWVKYQRMFSLQGLICFQDLKLIV